MFHTNNQAMSVNLNPPPALQVPGVTILADFHCHPCNMARVTNGNANGADHASAFPSGEDITRARGLPYPSLVFTPDTGIVVGAVGSAPWRLVHRSAIMRLTPNNFPADTIMWVIP